MKNDLIFNFDLECTSNMRYKEPVITKKPKLVGDAVKDVNAKLLDMAVSAEVANAKVAPFVIAVPASPAVSSVSDLTNDSSVSRLGKRIRGIELLCVKE